MSLAMKTSGATGASGRGLSLRKVGRAIAPVLAGLILATVILAALLAPWIAPHDPIAMSPMDRLKPPSADFILGTDAYGRDLFSRILYGARTSLVVGAGVAVAALLIGLPLGILAGFFLSLIHI